MKHNYDLTKPEGCSDYLNDLLAELNFADFSDVVHKNFPKAEADRLSEKYMDQVLIPLGRMLEVVERAHDLTKTPMSAMEKIEYARKHKGQKLFSATMYQVLNTTTISRIERAADKLKTTLMERINQISQAPDEKSADGIDYDGSTYREQEKAFERDAAKSKLDRKIEALTRHHQSLQLVYEQLHETGERFDTRASLFAIHKLYRAVQQLEGSEQRVER